MAFTTGDNNFGTAKWIVDATAGQGTHTTIAAALTAASSGQTIFIRPGTYTENLTLKAGVNLVAFSADSLTPNVTIVGKCTFTAAGTVSISGIQLQTNSDFALAVTGIAASVVNLTNCLVNCSNNTGISYTSSSSSSAIQLLYCGYSLGTNTTALFSSSGSGEIALTYVEPAFGCTTSSGASTFSAGALNLSWSVMACPISISSAANIEMAYSGISLGGVNATCLAITGTGTSDSYDCYFISGSASAISVGAGASLIMHGANNINSSNTNTITGAGTVKYGLIDFVGSSSGVNVSTYTANPVDIGIAVLGTPLTVANGGTGASTLTGVLTGNGTSAVTGNAVTQHGILIAGASNAVSTIAVASTGKVLQGNTGADPTFSTATFPSTATGTGTILRADGTNWVATTATYPATTGANTFLTSTTANTVSTDSYVPETSFTPALAFGGGTTGITYGTQVGTYQRIGNIVFFRVNIVLTSKGSSTGSATITGFPVNADASGTNIPVADYQGITFTASYTNLSIQMGSNTTATIVQVGSGQSIANIADTAFTNTAQFHFTGHYFV